MGCKHFSAITNWCMVELLGSAVSAVVKVCTADHPVRKISATGSPAVRLSGAALSEVVLDTV